MQKNYTKVEINMITHKPMPTRRITELAAVILRSAVIAWNLCRVHETSSDREDGMSTLCRPNL